MDRTVIVESAGAVRATIARVMLGAQLSEPVLGSIQLKPHQEACLARLESSLREFGGTLLCDDVGLGKTFVALAIARRFSRCLIVAPAALEGMWLDALARAETDSEFTTFEKLSRSEPPSLTPDLLVLDEAHHARNPRTRRYRRVAQLARGARVLLLTATPIHNRRSDFLALLSLFLGSRANDLTESELSRCVVRRERSETAEAVGIPRVMPVVARDVPDDPEIVAQLMSLPPPLPARDGGSGGTLINRGLVHQWSSSEAALREAIRRRIAKATALIESLRVGRYPTAAELEGWTFADGALQLGFAELLAQPTSHDPALLEAVLAHASALETFLRGYANDSLIDQARVQSLVGIRRENPGAKIVAFAQYSATVSEMFRRIVGLGQVAMLTATGARVAGGKLTREEAIARFAPRANRARSPSRAEAIDVLLATDLLSEGVNLQDAEVVIHLDVPWTAARMEQRVGRVARMGSRHSDIRVYQFRPPASGELVLRAEALVSTKWNLARRVVGANPAGPFPGSRDLDRSTSSIPSRAERVRAILARWSPEASSLSDSGVHAAAVSAGERGFIAAGYLGGAPLLLTCRADTLSVELDAQIAACLHAEGRELSVDSADYDAALSAINEWVAQYEASESAGVAVAAPSRRKRLLNRIDATLQRAPPHLRASRAHVAADARRVASTSHGVAIETDLDAFAESSLADDEWLKALASLATPNQRAPSMPRADFQLHALLLFTP